MSKLTKLQKDAIASLSGSQLLVICSSVGNPDYGQYAPLSEPEAHIVQSFEEASAISRCYIETWNLGGGNWSGGNIYDTTGKEIARISYNGRCWKPSSLEIVLDRSTVDTFYAHHTVLFTERMERLYHSL